MKQNPDGLTQRGFNHPKPGSESDEDDFSPLPKALSKRQEQIDFTEMIVFIITITLQFVMMLIMTMMDFKMFSIILFFTAPMWVLFVEALCLLVLRLSK